MPTIEIKVPDIGDFDSVEIIEILVEGGARVALEDPLITLESDKATMDIPSPANGVIHKLLVEVGQKVGEGAPIALLTPDGDAPQGDNDAIQTKNASQPADESTPRDLPTESTPAASPPPNQSVNPQPTPPTDSPARPSVAPSPDKLPHASPAMRRFARELGAQLAKIQGSGRKGRILRADIIAWVKQQLAHQPSAISHGGIPPIPEIDFSKFGEIEKIPLTRIKKISGPHLQRAWLNVPHVTHHDEADVTELEEFRQSLKAESEKEGIRITMLGFVVKIVTRALKKFPAFNASLHTDGETLIQKKYYHIGIAIDTPNGLVVPVIRNAERKTIFELASEMGELSKRARDGKLKSQDLQGGCISISSLGGIGGIGFTPIVNAPEVAVLGVSRATIRPVWDGKKFQPRLMLPLDLSYDHRVIDGAEAARFVAFLVQSFGDVRRLSL